MKLIAGAFGAALLFSAAAFGGTTAWEFTSIGSEGTDNTWVFGEVFTVNQDIFVDDLGYYDPSTGMLDTHDVSGDLLASTTITSASSPDSAHFLYNAITPVELFAGQTYVIEGVSGIDPYAFNDGGFTVDPAISIDGNNWQQGSSLVFNGTGLINDVTDGEWGANFEFTPAGVPEPASLLLLGSGMLGLGVLKRKRRSK